jgi:hypothetical protein
LANSFTQQGEDLSVKSYSVVLGDDLKDLLGPASELVDEEENTPPFADPSGPELLLGVGVLVQTLVKPPMDDPRLLVEVARLGDAG